MGNFPIFPQLACPGDDLNNCEWTSPARGVQWVKDSPRARPGSFNISLENGIHAEMTVSNHSALYRFTFPASNASFAPLSNGTASATGPVILVDLIDLPRSRSKAQASVDPSTGRLTGNGTFNPSFGIGSYNMYFCVDFKGAEIRDTGVFINDNSSTDTKTVSVGAAYTTAGAFVQFFAPADNVIAARAGVSFISVEKACANSENEIPDYDFDDLVSSAETAWRQKLEVISVDATGVSTDLQETFWSGAYRSMISPQDYTGENPLWESDEPYYDSYYWLVTFTSSYPISMTDR